MAIEVLRSIGPPDAAAFAEPDLCRLHLGPGLRQSHRVSIPLAGSDRTSSCHEAGCERLALFRCEIGIAGPPQPPLDNKITAIRCQQRFQLRCDPRASPGKTVRHDHPSEDSVSALLGREPRFTQSAPVEKSPGTTFLPPNRRLQASMAIRFHAFAGTDRLDDLVRSESNSPQPWLTFSPSAEEPRHT